MVDLMASDKKNSFNLLAIVGPTASGKTALAVQLANTYNGEIISADSRQVYRGLDIGSGKDLEEYGDIPYHLIDIVDPGYEFNVFEFQQRFIVAFNEIISRGKLPILAGGTGLYIDAVLNGYQLVAVPENTELRKKLESKTDDDLVEMLLQLKPEQHNTTDMQDRQRLLRAIEIAEAKLKQQRQENKFLPQFPLITPCIIGIQWDRTKLRQRITLRLKQRLETGLIEEVQSLHDGGVSWETLNFYGLEYRYVAQYLQGELNKNDMFQKLNSSIHNFAKKQDTWFRKMQRRGSDIHWLDGETELLPQAVSLIESDSM